MSSTADDLATPENKRDLFDPVTLAIRHDFLSSGGVKKHQTNIPVRKPNRDEWVRVHSDPAFVLDTFILESKSQNQMYLVQPELGAELTFESIVTVRRLHLAINRHGGIFIWPLKLPKPDGRLDPWCSSALEAADAAKHKWVRFQSDMSSGSYVYFTPFANLPDPTWPAELTLKCALKIAFRNYMIDTPNHIILRELRGEV